MLLLYLEGLQGSARERVEETADEIVDLEGGFTAGERELARAELAAASSSASAASSSSSGGDAKGGEAGANSSLAQQLSDKDADRLQKFRLLRAKKVLCALAPPDDSDAGDSDDGDGQ